MKFVKYLMLMTKLFLSVIFEHVILNTCLNMGKNIDVE